MRLPLPTTECTRNSYAVALYIHRKRNAKILFRNEKTNKREGEREREKWSEKGKSTYVVRARRRTLCYVNPTTSELVNQLRYEQLYAERQLLVVALPKLSLSLSPSFKDSSSHEFSIGASLLESRATGE